METCDVARESVNCHRRLEPADGRDAAAWPPELGALIREDPPPPAERGADEGARTEAVGLRGPAPLELAVGLVPDGAVRGTITGLDAPPRLTDDGITRLPGAR